MHWGTQHTDIDRRKSLQTLLGSFEITLLKFYCTMKCLSETIFVTQNVDIYFNGACVRQIDVNYFPKMASNTLAAMNIFVFQEELK